MNRRTSLSNYVLDDGEGGGLARPSDRFKAWRGCCETDCQRTAGEFCRNVTRPFRIITAIPANPPCSGCVCCKTWSRRWLRSAVWPATR